jgi:uncharacterized protein HemY
VRNVVGLCQQLFTPSDIQILHLLLVLVLVLVLVLLLLLLLRSMLSGSPESDIATAFNQ